MILGCRAVFMCWLPSTRVLPMLAFLSPLTPTPALLPCSCFAPRLLAGVVTSVAYHPSEPILASVSTDKKIYLGELTV